jgi:outer membrane protein assembly factor BamB
MTTRRRFGSIALFLAASVNFGAACPAAADDVLTYHHSNARNGLYTMPGLTLTAARHAGLDTSFKASVNGAVYAQPLYWHPNGAAAPELIVATENNYVYALNALTGAAIWQRRLPAPIAGGLPCGDIVPEGITGTPVIDPGTATLYLNAQTAAGGAPQHDIYALSLADGSIVSGWPINVTTALARAGVTFTPPQQGERSALLFFQGALYVAYGGRAGDCNPYHGVIVQIDPGTKSLAGNWETRAVRGGIWSQGGLSSDGKYLFATTGNTQGATSWSDGEAILRLLPGLAHATSTADYYAPSNWLTLDNEDLDIGGTEALPIGVVKRNGKTGLAPRLVALGKDGNAYLVNRLNLGGVGGTAEVTQVSTGAIITAPAVYNTDRQTLLAFTGSAAPGARCSGQALNVLDLSPGGNAAIRNKWCAALNGQGSPIITTTDGSADPVVWVLGAEGDNMLHGYNAVTGAVLYTGTTALGGLHRFQTLIAAGGHLYVAADNNVYSFRFAK